MAGRPRNRTRLSGLLVSEPMPLPRALCALATLSGSATGLLARRAARRRRRRPLRPWPRPPHAHRTACSATLPACGEGPALLANMSTRDKLAQLLTVGVTDAADARAVVNDHHVGGIMIGSWTDLSMLSDGSVADIAASANAASAGGQCGRGRWPGVAAGAADRHATVSAGARADPNARAGVPGRAAAGPGHARPWHHH